MKQPERLAVLRNSPIYPLLQPSTPMQKLWCILQGNDTERYLTVISKRLKGRGLSEEQERDQISKIIKSPYLLPDWNLRGQFIEEVFDTLPEATQKVIGMFYGLYDSPCTLAEIVATYCPTRTETYVQSMIQEGIKDLRTQIAEASKLYFAPDPTGVAHRLFGTVEAYRYLATNDLENIREEFTNLQRDHEKVTQKLQCCEELIWSLRSIIENHTTEQYLDSKTHPKGETPIEKLPLAKRTQECLMKANITTCAHLAVQHCYALVRLGIKGKDLQEINDLLVSLGYYPLLHPSGAFRTD